MSQFEDRTLKCIDCSTDFIFTAGEQEFYARKGFQQEPKRCKMCRDTRKTRGRGSEDAGGGGGPPTPRSSSRSSAAPVVENRTLPTEARATRGGGGREREMFEVVCAGCAQPARVPFRPSPGRPVYCKTCYGSRRGDAGG